MKINKERIRENSVKCKNTMQITLDDDFNVPDSKADIDSIIREWGNPCGQRESKRRTCRGEGKSRFCVSLLWKK